MITNAGEVQTDMGLKQWSNGIEVEGLSREKADIIKSAEK